MSLFIGNIAHYLSKKDIEEAFNKFGKCEINYKGTYAFAEYEEEKNAGQAKCELNKRVIYGRNLNIEWSKKSKNYENKRYNHIRLRGKCYICGKRDHYARDCPDNRRKSRSRKYSRDKRKYRSRSRSHRYHKRNNSRSSSFSSRRNSRRNHRRYKRSRSISSSRSSRRSNISGRSRSKNRNENSNINENNNNSYIKGKDNEIKNEENQKENENIKNNETK